MPYRSTIQSNEAAKSQESSAVVIYGRGGGAPLRMVAGVSIICALASFILGAILFESSRSEIDEIVNASPAYYRGVTLLTTAALFGSISITYWRYAGSIVSRIVFLLRQRSLKVTSLTVVGTLERKFSLADVSVLCLHEGDSAGEESFSGPWVQIATKHGRPMLVPLNGSAREKGRVVQLLTHLCASSRARSESCSVHSSSAQKVRVADGYSNTESSAS